MDPSRVLLVAYLFPPAGGAPVMRSLSFAKHLSRLGYEVVVLSAKNPSYAVSDPSLEKQIPANVPVYRTLTPELPFHWRDRIWRSVRGGESQPAVDRADRKEPAWKQSARGFIRALAMPDPQRGWVPFAVRKAAALIRQHRIDTVIVTVPPFSGLDIGVRLKRKFPHVKLVSDFRDDWPYTLRGLRVEQDATLWNRATQLERASVQASDYVVSATPAWTDGMRARYPDQRADKFLYVPNGYDPEAIPEFPPPPRREKLVLTHAGSVQNNLVYSPAPFLDALDGLAADEASQIEIRFVGRVAPAAESLLANRRVTIVRSGFVPHAQALRLIGESDGLLLLLGSAAAGAHSAKLFEYLAAGRPVLAVGPKDSEARRILEETGGGCHVDATDPDAIRNSVRAMLSAWRAGRPVLPHGRNRKVLEAYSRPALAARLASLTGLCPRPDSGQAL